MITNEWRKFKGWQVLEFFLRTGEIYIKKLARALGISPQTANYYLKFYKKINILEEKKEGNLLIYSLMDNCLVRQLKIFYILSFLYPFALNFCRENKITSLVLYGSHANGTYDKNSDIDFLVISQQKNLKLDEVKKLEREINKEVKIQIFSIGKWRFLKRRKDKFALSILRNHILLYGAEI